MSKKELIKATKARYLKADKKTKGLMLDELCANTGYVRKYAIAILAAGYDNDLIASSGRKSRRKKALTLTIEEFSSQGTPTMSKGNIKDWYFLIPIVSPLGSILRGSPMDKNIFDPAGEPPPICWATPSPKTSTLHRSDLLL